MAKRTKKPKTVLKLPDLDYSRSAVLNSLPSLNSRRSYEHAIRNFINWYCSQPRLAFNRTVTKKRKLVTTTTKNSIVTKKKASRFELAYS
jgi:hypothetical protein